MKVILALGCYLILVATCDLCGAENTDPVIKAYAEKYTQLAQENPSTLKWFKTVWLQTNAKSQSLESILSKYLKGNNYAFASRVSDESISKAFPKPSLVEYIYDIGESSGKVEKDFGRLKQDNIDEQASTVIKGLADLLENAQFKDMNLLWGLFENDYLSYFANVASDILKMAVNNNEGFIADARCQLFNNCKK